MEISLDRVDVKGSSAVDYMTSLHLRHNVVLRDELCVAFKIDGMQIHVPLMPLLSLSPLVAEAVQGLPCACLSRDLAIILPEVTLRTIRLFSLFVLNGKVFAPHNEIVKVMELCTVLGFHSNENASFDLLESSELPAYIKVEVDDFDTHDDDDPLSDYASIHADEDMSRPSSRMSYDDDDVDVDSVVDNDMWASGENYLDNVATGARTWNISCPECGKTFHSSSSLSMHMSVHTNLKPYICICGKDFKHPAHLAAHKLRCELCPSERKRSRGRSRGRSRTRRRKWTSSRSHSVGVPKEHEIHTCDICDRRFTSLRSLNTHVFEHTGEKRFQCSVCGLRFIQEFNLKKHQSQFHQNGETQDEFPEDEHTDKIKSHVYTDHIYSATEPETADDRSAERKRSRSRSRSLSQGRSIQREMNTGNNTVVSCEHCGQEFGLFHHYLAHLSKHTGIKPYQCDLCPKGFVYPKLLENHALMVHGEHRTVLPVEKPPEVIARARELASLGKRSRSVQREDEAGEDNASEDFDVDNSAEWVPASKRRRRRSSSVLSVRSTTSEGYSATCEYCGRAFSFYHHYVAHLSTHTGQRPYSCDKCSSAFVYPKLLQKHLLTEHGESRIVQSIRYDQTDEIATDVRSQSVDRDVTVSKKRALHTRRARSVSAVRNMVYDGEGSPNDGAYLCKYCDSRFAFLPHFLAHLPKHTGRKPYICTECPKGFLYPKMLENHYVNAHGLYKRVESIKELTDELTKAPESPIKMPVLPEKTDEGYVCQYCEKPFEESFAFIAHMYTHTGVHPFRCTRCPSGFIYYNSLQQHMKDKHKLHTLSNQSEDLNLRANHVPHLQENKQQNLMDEAVYYCAVCSASFTSEKHMKEHTKEAHAATERTLSSASGSPSLHSNSDHLQCPYCEKQYKTALRLKMHVKKNHSGPKILQCAVCNQRITGHRKFAAHMASHQNSTYPCLECGITFPEESALTSHILSHMQNRNDGGGVSSVIFETDLSESSTINLGSSYSRVSNTHSEKGGTGNVTMEEIPGFVPQAAEGLPTQDMQSSETDGEPSVSSSSRQLDLSKIYDYEEGKPGNIEPMRPLEKKYKCGSCDQKFIKDSHLQQHMLLFHPTNQVAVNGTTDQHGASLKQCTYCQVWFENSKDSQKHMCSFCSKEEGQQTMYQCTQCSESFINLRQYKSHMVLVHPVQEFLCEMCGLSFSSALRRTWHVRKEHGTNLYNCENCKGSFSSMSLLNRHVIKMHSRELDVKCVHCGLSFANKQKLYWHIRKMHSHIAHVPDTAKTEDTSPLTTPSELLSPGSPVLDHQDPPSLLPAVLVPSLFPPNVSTSVS